MPPKRNQRKIPPPTPDVQRALARVTRKRDLPAPSLSLDSQGYVRNGRFIGASSNNDLSGNMVLPAAPAPGGRVPKLSVLAAQAVNRGVPPASVRQGAYVPPRLSQFFGAVPRPAGAPTQPPPTPPRMKRGLKKQPVPPPRTKRGVKKQAKPRK